MFATKKNFAGKMPRVDKPRLNLTCNQSKLVFVCVNKFHEQLPFVVTNKIRDVTSLHRNVTRHIALKTELHTTYCKLRE